MTTQRYDIITARPGKDGKTFWHRVGTMFPAREGNGFAIKLDSLPLPNDKGEVWLKAAEPRQNDSGSQF